jgi:predicted dehydrogenase
MDEMIETEEPDGVIICIGPEAHSELAPDVMRRGIPVYTEKPPGPDAETVHEVATISRETGVLCMTAFKKRYSTVYDRAKDWIDSFDEIDKSSISVDYASGKYSNDSLRSSFLLDFCIHLIDLVSYLFGDVDRVSAITKDHHAYSVSLKFEDGSVGSLNFTDGRSWNIPTEEVEITMTEGNFMTIHNSSSWRITEDHEATEWREPPTFISSGDSGYNTGHLAEIEAFLKAIETGQPTRSNIFESYKSMVLYEAIRESAETNQPVDITYDPL